MAGAEAWREQAHPCVPELTVTWYPETASLNHEGEDSHREWPCRGNLVIAAEPRLGHGCLSTSSVMRSLVYVNTVGSAVPGSPARSERMGVGVGG